MAGHAANRVQTLVKLGVLTAVILILAFSPIGYIPFGAMRITIVQIPVIVGACVVGPLGGGILGAVFGLTSLYLAPTDPVFAAILNINPLMMAAICIVPRILVGLLSGAAARLVGRFDRTGVLAYGIAGAVGAITNTVLILGSIYVFFAQVAMEILQAPSLGAVGAILAGIGISNGVPEIIASVILVSVISKALVSFERRR